MAEVIAEATEGAGSPLEVIQSASPARISLRRLRRDKVAVTCGGIILVIVLLALFAPVICGLWGISTAANSPATNLDPLAGNLPRIGPPLHGFTLAHPLGLSPIDASDNLANLLYGMRTDLGIALVATVLSTVIGVVLGLISGFSRGAADRVITFFTDTFLCFPFILGALALAPIIDDRFASHPSLLAVAQISSLVLILVIFGWMGLTRLIRGYVITLREQEFIQAAQVAGLRTWHILRRELLPNLVAPIVISVSLTLPSYVGIAAGLSFLGIGITGAPSLGQTIANAVPYFQSYPLFLYSPVAVLAVIVLSLNLLGDSVRDAFDPRTRR